MRKELHRIVSLALLACLLPPVLSGCRERALDVDGNVSVPVLLSVGGLSEGLTTKMTDRVAQCDDPRTFRGIQTFYVVPFTLNEDTSSGAVREYIRATDISQKDNIQLSGTLQAYDFDGTGAAKGYYSGSTFVPSKTNSVLVYGQATEDYSATVQPGTIAAKRRNGVLHPGGPVVSRSVGALAQDFTFDLESCLFNTRPDFDAWKDANRLMLNAIASVEVNGSGKFRDPATYGGDASLAAAFAAFTGGTFSSAGEAAVLTRLYNSCASLPATAHPTAAALASRVCETIRGYASGTRPMLSVTEAGGRATVQMLRDPYSEFNLPDGAIAWKWGEWQVGSGGSGFGSPGKAEGVNLADIEDYCYPPSLVYYVNSPLMGNSTGGMQSQFEDRTRYPGWSDIVNASYSGVPFYTRGVTLDSKAALIRDPLQYAVALLKLQIGGLAGSGVTWLEDRDGNLISVEGRSFPLTGIIIGSQRTQNFDFTASGSDMRFIFDADVNDDTGTPKAWISSDQPNATLYTLVLETRRNEDVYFALEFRNDSGVTFYGARDCTVLPGSKFYLLGCMAYSAGTGAGPDKPASVFVKDHITTLSVRFEALASAYTILPELTSPDLQMGVRVKLNWDAATPSGHELQ